MLRDDEPRLTDQNRPACPQCGVGMRCLDCEYEDLKPEASELYAGCRLLTPFGRWETVSRIVSPKFGRMTIFTEESGGRPWRYWRTSKVRYTKPLASQEDGTPELRMVQQYGRDGAMYLVATRSTIHNPSLSGAVELAYARYNRTAGWNIVYYPDPETDLHTTEPAGSKAKARTRIRQLGKQYAKEMGVAFNPGAPS